MSTIVQMLRDRVNASTTTFREAYVGLLREPNPTKTHASALGKLADALDLTIEQIEADLAVLVEADRLEALAETEPAIAEELAVAEAELEKAGEAAVESRE